MRRQNKRTYGRRYPSGVIFGFAALEREREIALTVGTDTSEEKKQKGATSFFASPSGARETREGEES